uniref:Spindle and centriole-associated protein 1 n=1 Tax=Strongyloides papillosus TaxID=174720 RepID=A0A0N5CC30_STREA
MSAVSGVETVRETLRIVKDNYRLLLHISEKQEHLADRIDELEGRIRVMRVKNRYDSPPPSDTETSTLKIGDNNNEVFTTNGLSFTDSSDSEDDFKDASQALPSTVLDFKQKIGADYPCTLYYFNEDGRIEKRGPVTCAFMKVKSGYILEVTNKETGDDLQIICGVGGQSMYEVKKKDGYIVIRIKTGALVYSMAGIASILLKFVDGVAGSKVYKGLSCP